MSGSRVRAELHPIVSVLMVWLVLLGIYRTLPALVRIPELRGQFLDHLGAGITPLWAHLVVVAVMTSAAVVLVWSDECTAALFALVGAMYASEPIEAVGGSELSVERLLVPLIVTLAILIPEPLPRTWMTFSLGCLLALSLAFAVAEWSGIADDGGLAPWGNELFYLGDAILFPIGLIGVLVLVFRSKRQLSLKALSLWSGFGPFALFFTCALLWPALQDLIQNQAAVTTIVLSLVIAPIGVVVARYLP